MFVTSTNEGVITVFLEEKNRIECFNDCLDI